MDAALHGPRPVRVQPAARPTDISWPIWGLTTFSLTCLALGVGFGQVFTATFLLCWLLYALAWPTRALNQLLQVRLPWLFPLLALSSVLWSQAPGETLRTAVQLLTVTAFGILIARAQPARSFIAAVMCMMLVSVLLGTAGGGTAVIGMTGESALVGVFGSKNNLATMVSFMVIAACAVLPDRRQPWALRLLAVLCCVLGPIFMLLAKSLSATITLTISLACFAVFALLARLPARVRPLFLVSAILLGLGGLGLFWLLQATGAWDELLRAAGKNSTLTGRVFIWQRAAQLIDLRPVFGIGYEAFWLRESVEAEGIWRLAMVSGRYGFSFHNLYYEVAIALGMLGATILIGTLLAVAVAVVVKACRQPGIEQAFFVAVIVMMFMRAFVEVDFVRPFSLGSLMLPIFWVYNTRAVHLATPAAARPPARPAGLRLAG